MLLGLLAFYFVSQFFIFHFKRTAKSTNQVTTKGEKWWYSALNKPKSQGKWNFLIYSMKITIARIVSSPLRSHSAPHQLTLLMSIYEASLSYIKEMHIEWEISLPTIEPPGQLFASEMSQLTNKYTASHPPDSPRCQQWQPWCSVHLQKAQTWETFRTYIQLQPCTDSERDRPDHP
jgi:hypothetical protein